MAKKRAGSKRKAISLRPAAAELKRVGRQVETFKKKLEPLQQKDLNLNIKDVNKVLVAFCRKLKHLGIVDPDALSFTPPFGKPK